MIETHKRVNETGQAMNESTAAVSPSSPSRSMSCFIMIKDKTGINDTFTFSHQRETCLNLTESGVDQEVCFIFSPPSAQGEMQGYRNDVAQCIVSLDVNMEKCQCWNRQPPSLRNCVI